DHWSPYDASSGVASAARLRSSSTEATRASVRRASALARLRSIACIRRAGIESVSKAPTAASAAAWSADDVPATNVAMKCPTGAGVRVGAVEGASEADGARVGSGVGAGVASGVAAGDGSGVTVGSGGAGGSAEGYRRGGGGE